MNSFQRNPAWLLLVLAAILTCTQATEENGNPDILNVPDIFPQTATVLELLDHLQDSHGTTLSHILTLLLERVRASAVSDEVAKKIKEAIRFIDDPKTKEILDIIGGVSTYLCNTLLKTLWRISSSYPLHIQTGAFLGQVVQSIVSLTSSLVVKLLTVLVSTVSNSQVFLQK